MTARACLGCGVLEQRTDKAVNLDPVLSLCVDCLIEYAKETRGMQPYLDQRDWPDNRARQVGSE